MRISTLKYDDPLYGQAARKRLEDLGHTFEGSEGFGPDEALLEREDGAISLTTRDKIDETHTNGVYLLHVWYEVVPGIEESFLYTEVYLHKPSEEELERIDDGYRTGGIKVTGIYPLFKPFARYKPQS